jgi:hypothetical protein
VGGVKYTTRFEFFEQWGGISKSLVVLFQFEPSDSDSADRTLYNTRFHFILDINFFTSISEPSVSSSPLIIVSPTPSPLVTKKLPTDAKAGIGVGVTLSALVLVAL